MIAVIFHWWLGARCCIVGVDPGGRRPDRRLPEEGHCAAVPRRSATAKSSQQPVAPPTPRRPPERCWPCTFPPAGSDVTCAVSGGADSMALLALAVAAGCTSPPCTSTTACDPARQREARHRRRRRRALRGGVSRARRSWSRRAQPGSPRPCGPLRSPARRCADRPHRRRPGRDGAGQPAAWCRPATAWRACDPAPGGRSWRCAAIETVASVRGARHHGRRRSVERDPALLAQPGAPRAAAADGRDLASATWCRCWPVRPA